MSGRGRFSLFMMIFSVWLYPHFLLSDLLLPRIVMVVLIIGGMILFVVPDYPND